MNRQAVVQEMVKVAKLLVSKEKIAAKEVTIQVTDRIPLDWGAPKVMFGEVDSVGYNGREFWWRSKNGLKNSYSDRSRFIYSLSQEMSSSGKALQFAKELEHRFDAES